MKTRTPVRSIQVAIWLTTQEKIQNLLNQVIDLIEKGKLGEREGAGLISCLNTAVERLNQGKMEAAADILEASVNEIEAMVKAGKLTPAKGVVLVKAALNVLVE